MVHSNHVPLFVTLLSVAILTKVGAGFLGARLIKFSREASFAVGFLMNAIGMVELIIASIGFAEGIIDLTMFSVAVVIGFVTTIMAPVMSRPFINNMKGSILIVDDHKKI